MSCPIEILYSGTALTPLSLFTLLTSITNISHVHQLSFRHEYNDISIDFKPSISVFTPTELEIRTNELSSYCHFQGIGRDGLSAWLSVCDPDHIEMKLKTPNASFRLEYTNDSFRLVSDGNDSCDILWKHVTKRGSFAPQNFLFKHNYYEQYSHLFSRKRYIEFAMFGDYSLFANYGYDKVRTRNHMLSILHMTNSIFASINIEIRLVLLEIFETPYIISIDCKNGTIISQSFTRYLKKKYGNNRLHYDSATLIIGNCGDTGDEIIGRGNVGAICNDEGTEKSISWVQNHGSYLSTVASLLAHELGHNLGMKHDNEFYTCACPMKQCVMNDWVYQTSQFWSNCSLASLEKLYRNGGDYCLWNEPENPNYNSMCGNGIVERGEDCDCGSLGCIIHNCCDMRTCKFRRYAQCTTGSCCDLETCSIHSASRLCRSPIGTCDLPEFCDGRNSECPVDKHVTNGAQCSRDENAICYGGRCGSRKLQCKEIWGENSMPAPLRCYENNLDKYGCGMITSISEMRCAYEDILCGRLQCTAPNHTTAVEGMDMQHHWFEKDGCHSMLAYYQDGYVPEYHLGMTPDGASCGYGKYCLKSKCVSKKEFLHNSNIYSPSIRKRIQSIRTRNYKTKRPYA